MTAVLWGRDNLERLRELAAQIAIEQDHDKFTALVKEFNELVDGEQQEPLKSRRKGSNPRLQAKRGAIGWDSRGRIQPLL